MSSKWLKVLSLVIAIGWLNQVLLSQKRLINQVEEEIYLELDSVKVSIDSVGKYLKIHNEMIQSLKAKEDSLYYELGVKNKEIETYKRVLEIDSHLFDGTSMYLSILSVFITVLAILVPGLFYFAVYKPNQKLKNEIDSKINDTLDSRLDKQLKDKIEYRKNQLLDSLNTPDGLSDTINALYVNDFKYNNLDAIKIIDFLSEYPNLETHNLDYLHGILRELDFHEVRSFYRGIINSDFIYVMEYAVQFFIEHDLDESHIYYLRRMIKSSKLPHELLKLIIKSVANRFLHLVGCRRSDQLREIGLKKLSYFLDSKDVVAEVKDKPIKYTLGGINYQVYLANVFMHNKELKEFLYYKEVLAPIYNNIKPEVDREKKDGKGQMNKSKEVVNEEEE